MTNSKLTIQVDRKFTRHNLESIGLAPNPDADPKLIAALADANDNGAKTIGDEYEGVKTVKVYKIDQGELPLDTALYIASKGVGCDVFHCDVCSALIKIDLNDEVPTHIAGFTPDPDAATPLLWSDWFSSSTRNVVTDDQGETYAPGGTFLGSGTKLTARQHLEMKMNGVDLIHPSSLTLANHETV